MWGFSAALCRGLIEGRCPVSVPFKAQRFSAALCRGLIEGTPRASRCTRGARRFPRLYVAASLKGWNVENAACRSTGFPRLYVAASLKVCRWDLARGGGYCGFPRLYVAASLKDGAAGVEEEPVARFSAALCRGLIEGRAPAPRTRPPRGGFPRLYVAASLKARSGGPRLPDRRRVFRGFMSRPH